ncbi:hypothetical protein LP419_38950 [Massilia sp. H-1]|nr:hypothetical protein LP419_38950 [Massilia sp. H-1]
MLAAAAILASAAMGALYVRGGHAWLLGFVFLVPWLRALDAGATLGGTLLRAWGMALAFTAVKLRLVRHRAGPVCTDRRA